ncbi:MAG TPA: lipoyl synthase, partial [Bacteroidetes bacterium]|nr:lipoyl synthase [Bacteroidota bacterium]
IQPQSNYQRSLDQIKRIRDFGKRTKSGIMVGLGETMEEVFELMDDLLEHGCQILTIGQYLQPTLNHAPVVEYVHPDIFKMYKEMGLEKGFEYVESGPLVRSSYHAERQL